MLMTPEEPTPVQIELPPALLPKVIETPTLTLTTSKKPVLKFVPPVHWAMLPTMLAAAKVLSTVFPLPELATPVRAY